MTLDKWTRRVIERLTRLQEVTAAFSKALTPAEVAQVVIDQGVAALDASAGRILLLSEDRATLTLLGAVGYPPAALDRWQSIAIDHAVPTAVAARTGKPIWLTSREALVSQFPAVTRVPLSTQAFAVVPLECDDRPIGVLGLSFEQPREFDEDERRFIVALAQQCAQALERSRLYEREQQARQEAEAAVRVRDEFLSVAAHELRTPLTAVKAAAQLLERQLARPSLDPARLSPLARQLTAEVERLEMFVVDLLDLARLQRGRPPLRPARVNLVALAEQVLTRARQSVEGRSEYALVLDAPEPIEGTWDAIRLEQVLTNLIFNALHYSPHGGEVRVEVKGLGDMAMVAVHDQGIGIPPEEQNKLFQPFVQTRLGRRTRGEGLGLGLYICAQIVEQHGGTIDVESEPGAGSTFTVRLPLESAAG